MSEIKRAQYDAVWRMLWNLNSESGNPRSAGQVGRALGISRNTAKKYLDELIETKTVIAHKFVWINGQQATFYAVIIPPSE